MDARWTTIGNAWVCGVNCWDKQGYSIGTPVLNDCFNINLNGHVDIPYTVHTPKSMVDSIKSLLDDQITINDNVIVAGDIMISGRCNIFNNLRGLETSEFGKTIIIKTSEQGGGHLRIEPSTDNQESSIGHDNRTDLRATVASDV